MQHRVQRAGWRYRVVRSVAACGLAAMAAACGRSEPPKGEPAAAPAAVAEAADHGGGHAAGSARVTFVQPQDGATVKSPVHFEFASEGVQIAAVPQGTVEQARAGMGHFHLGVETACLPEGQEIPKGTPGWVHFGKGDNRMDMQLTPGPHTFSVQVGDDQHRTVAGLCQTIRITVE